MSEKTGAEDNINKCIGELELVLSNYKCGLSMDDNGNLLICHEYTGANGENYILVKKAFDITESKHD